MNLLFFSVTSTVLCILFAVALKYLSLLQWVTGHAYVLSKRRKYFSILELLDLLKNVRPFPISCQKGWKIDSYSHGHRVWFNFLTFPHNLNAPSIKVYAVFNRVQSTSQAVLQVLKNISRSSEWKPGVISAASTHSLSSSEVPLSAPGSLSVPVHVDSVKEEILSYSKSKFGLQRHDAWFTENVVPTVTLEYKRFWHKEDNGVCWLLQMNEKLQTSEFYLIQPALDIDHCLISVVTWSREHSPSSVERASVLLSSLIEYISLRRLQITPLISMTLPREMSENMESSNSRKELTSSDQNTPFSSKGHNNTARNRQYSDSSIIKNRKADLEKSSSILKYGCKNGKLSTSASTNCASTSTVVSSDNGLTSLFIPEGHDPSSLSKSDEVTKSTHVRSISDVTAIAESHKMDIDPSGVVEEVDSKDDEKIQEQKVPSQLESLENISETADITVAQFKTTDTQCASELLAEIKRASDINLELSLDKQAEFSGGWQFSSFEKNIVVLKKLQRQGTPIQSYIGKGFVLAPPKAVWDAVRNPRIRFTYDETLKKVDIVSTIDNSLKIVYFYHESLQFLVKECCDMCVLQGERKDGQKYVLTYSSIENEKCPVKPNVTRAKIAPSGWVIEPARQDNKVYSIVTYLMQIDFGHYPESSDILPFQEMISNYPLSIADLQQYLKPAVQMLRQKSVA